MTHCEPRFICLCRYLANYFGMAVEPSLISGDASFRRYFRVEVQAKSYIVVDSPPALVNNIPFVRLSERYLEADLNVPTVIDFDEERNSMIHFLDLPGVLMLTVWKIGNNL